jgi:hypothetical protein
MATAPALATLFALSLVTNAAVLPAGTKLEARLSTATGSRISHPGDRVQALVIAPVYAENRLVVPQGAVLSGVVESVARLGLGIKHDTAKINFAFTSLRMPDGSASPLEARTVEVETARERVAGDGDVRGINPNVNLSSGASILISALMSDVEFSVPALGVKFLLARSPDPEIFFPAGTELILQLSSSATLRDLDSPPIVREIEQSDERIAESVIDSLPQQQTSLGQNRPSDLVNVLLLGTRQQIERAFHAAGWYGEQRHSAIALYRMYHCLVQRTGYSMGPMTRLRLNGEFPDAVYQKSLDTFSKRHHIRLWRQNRSDVWVGATTEDIAYRFRRMHVTHATDSDIDNERAKVVNDLWMTGCVSSASILHRDHLQIQQSPGLPISTDGSVAVLRMNDCATPLPTWFASNKPSSIRTYPLSQIFVAIGSDLAHSNPLTLGYTVTRTILSGAPLEGVNGFRSLAESGGQHSRQRFGDAAQRVAWKRPSVTDPEMAASPTLTAKNQP